MNAMEKRALRATYIAIALELLLTLSGLILVFGRSLDVNSIIVDFGLPLCVLPFLFGFFAYITLENISPTVKGPAFFPFAANEHEGTVRISFYVALASTIGGLVMLILCNNNGMALAGLACVIIANVPGMVTYYILTIRNARKYHSPRSMIWPVATFFVATIVLSIATLVLMCAVDGGFCLMMFGYPLLCALMILAGRKEG